MLQLNTRIRELRRSPKIKLTMEQFGKRLGVTKTAISRIENGERGVTEQMILAICREFNVNETWLRTGEGDMFIELSKEEYIAGFIGKILKNKEDSFKKRYIEMLSKLDEEGWCALESIANAMGQIKKD